MCHRYAKRSNYSSGIWFAFLEVRIVTVITSGILQKWLGEIKGEIWTELRRLITGDVEYSSADEVVESLSLKVVLFGLVLWMLSSHIMCVLLPFVQ